MPMPLRSDDNYSDALANLPSDLVLPEISVKNTFICCDDFPPEMDLQRSVTDSAEASKGGPLNPALYPPPKAQTSGPNWDAIPETSEYQASEYPDDDSGPPTPMAMTRAITQEIGESQYEWSWAFDQDAMPMQQQQPQQMRPMQPMQPMMQMMPMMPMMPQQSPNQPQMAVYMPIPMRGVRWPDEMPGPQPGSTQQMPAPGGPPDTGGMPNRVGVPQSGAYGNPGPSSSIPKVEAPQSSGGYGTNAGDSSVAKREPPKYTVSDEPPALQPLTRAFSVGSGAFRINWTLSATKLRSADKNAVSPAFELSFGGAYSSTKFKLMLLPQVSSEGKGGSTFRKSDGKGYLLLKCEADLHEGCGNLKFRLFVGSQAPRGPVTHDFSQSAVKGLPKELETWDLNASVNNGYVVVGAEIIPIGAC